MLFEAAGRDRIGEDKKSALASQFLVQSLDEQSIFVIEHRLETIAADVTIGRAVDRIAESHVVGRHRLRHRARRAADMEKAPGHFLAGADLREGAVLLRVEIDLERLLVRPDIHLRVHTRQDVDNSGLLNRLLPVGVKSQARRA